MAVYFNKLFDLISERGMLQKDLMKTIGCSSATFAKMKNNQEVSFGVLLRICETLNCDFGDIVSCRPPEKEIITNDIEETNSVVRDILIKYMQTKNMSLADVSSITGLALNTLKSFFKGNSLSAASHKKLKKLGEDFIQAFENEIQKSNSKVNCIAIVCNKCGKRKSKCWASQSVWNPKSKMYECYCAFGFSRKQNEDGQYITYEECPHPTNMYEFDAACKNYDYNHRGTVEHIPAKESF